MLDDAALLNRTEAFVKEIGRRAEDGSWMEDIFVSPRQWWEYAETVVGFIDIWQLTGRDHALATVMKTWSFINDYLVDREEGEWFWTINTDHTPLRTEDKAGFWKCPYHNSRMCLEIIERVSKA